MKLETLLTRADRRMPPRFRWRRLVRDLALVGAVAKQATEPADVAWIACLLVGVGPALARYARAMLAELPRDVAQRVRSECLGRAKKRGA